jgi:hypothetical protein
MDARKALVTVAGSRPERSHCLNTHAEQKASRLIRLVTGHVDSCGAPTRLMQRPQ